MKLEEAPNTIISPITGDELTRMTINEGDIYVVQELNTVTECFDSCIVWYWNEYTKESMYLSYDPILVCNE